MHWVHDYLGKPWVAYARGPDTYDCWGLVMAVLSEQFRCEDLPGLNHVTTDNTQEIHQAFSDQIRSGYWQHSPVPVHGSVAVCFIRGKSAKLVVRHVGIYLDIDGGGVLHCHQGALSKFEPVTRIKRLFPKVEFYVRTHSRFPEHS
ncbi:hypothetical protein [Endozoicomonas sp. ISHI1]|uniref:hypothetical protein n=1 Tax=Endozoicomonas sp. ISHI1 TaxID=2825882 RepID=UPI00214969C2|nr:hypothetical protein [Endozoicomonas sp. ISHI1]